MMAVVVVVVVVVSAERVWNNHNTTRFLSLPEPAPDLVNDCPHLLRGRNVPGLSRGCCCH